MWTAAWQMLLRSACAKYWLLVVVMMVPAARRRSTWQAQMPKLQQQQWGRRRGRQQMLAQSRVGRSNQQHLRLQAVFQSWSSSSAVLNLLKE